MMSRSALGNCFLQNGFCIWEYLKKCLVIKRYHIKICMFTYIYSYMYINIHICRDMYLHTYCHELVTPAWDLEHLSVCEQHYITISRAGKDLSI